MKEQRFSPFKEGNIIGESNYSNVWVFPGSEIAVKQPKPDNPIYFDSVDDVKSRILQMREDLKTARERADLWGIDSNSFTPTDFIIHANPDGRIVYSRTQYKIKNARTLAQERGGFVRYPTSTLRQLKGLFEMNLYMKNNEGTGVDVVGSSKRKLPLFVKGARLALPLFTSGNIMVDEDKNLHFVDLEVHRPFRKPFGAKKKLGIAIEAFGSATSIVMLNALIKFRELARTEPKERS